MIEHAVNQTWIMAQKWRRRIATSNAIMQSEKKVVASSWLLFLVRSLTPEPLVRIWGLYLECIENDTIERRELSF